MNIQRRDLLKRASTLAAALPLLPSGMAHAHEADRGKTMAGRRRVVTGVDASGRSTVVSDEHLPEPSAGGESVTIFSSDPSTTVPLHKLATNSVDPRRQPPFATAWRVIHFPPLGSPKAQDGALHTTDTIDYLAVRSGELTLLLDDGVEVVLKAGDYLVQGGVAHGWLNRGSVPCVVECIIVGLPRAQG